MKLIQVLRSHIRFVLATAATVFFLTGCASTEATNTKSLLSAAGFKVRTPQTKAQKELYDSLEPNKVARATVKGKVFYVFKDAEAGIAYVGHEPEYQQYKKLAIEQRIGQDQYMAAQMEREMAWRWYGAYGYRGLYW